MEKEIMDWIQLGGILTAIGAIAGILFQSSRDTKSLERDHKDLSGEHQSLSKEHSSLQNTQTEIKQTQQAIRNEFLNKTETVLFSLKDLQNDTSYLKEEVKERRRSLENLDVNQRMFERSLENVSGLFDEYLNLNQKRLQLAQQVNDLDKENQTLREQNQHYLYQLQNAQREIQQLQQKLNPREQEQDFDLEL